MISLFEGLFTSCVGDWLVGKWVPTHSAGRLVQLPELGPDEGAGLPPQEDLDGQGNLGVRVQPMWKLCKTN